MFDVMSPTAAFAPRYCYGKYFLSFSPSLIRQKQRSTPQGAAGELTGFSPAARSKQTIL